MTKSQFVTKLADKTGLSKKQIDIVLDEMVTLITTSVKKGDPDQGAKLRFVEEAPYERADGAEPPDGGADQDSGAHEGSLHGREELQGHGARRKEVIPPGSLSAARCFGEDPAAALTVLTVATAGYPPIWYMSRLRVDCPR